MSSTLIILAGIATVILFVYLLKSIVMELVWFGSTIALLESWHFWGDGIGLPPMPEWLMVFASAYIWAWVILRLLMVLPVVFQRLAKVTAQIPVAGALISGAFMLAYSIIGLVKAPISLITGDTK